MRNFPLLESLSGTGFADGLFLGPPEGTEVGLLGVFFSEFEPVALTLGTEEVG